MKIIYACKQSKFLRLLWYFLLIMLVLSLVLNLTLLFEKPPSERKTSPIWLNIISNILVFFTIFFNAIYKCKKSFVQFDDELLTYKTNKNIKTLIPYKNIDSHEIHIFEIVFHLKNGKKEVLNLDNFTYENIRKIKQILLKKLG